MKTVLFALALCCPQTVSFAAELASRAPPFTLVSLTGESVTLTPPPRGTLLILYFFDPSDEAIDILAGLNEAITRNPKALSLLAIARGNIEDLKASLAPRDELYPVVLNDKKGVTFAYGLRGKLPAAVIVGPDTRIAAVLAPVATAQKVVLASADTFISLGFPDQAGRLYRSASKDGPGAGKAALGDAYARVLAGDGAAARQTLNTMKGGSSPISSEAHAALGFLEFRLGRDSAALAACGRASGRGFAEYVMGKTNARAGQCRAASSLFTRARDGRFAFKWQEAVTLGMAARVAEDRADVQAALDSYKKAAALAPLNPTINANLLSLHWRGGNFPAAVRYAAIIKSIEPDDPLIITLVGEFEAEREFRGNAAARKRLKRKVSAGAKRAGRPRTILVPDLTATDCSFELRLLPTAAAGLLKLNLEEGGSLATISRPEMLAAAEQLGIPQKNPMKPDHLLKLAKALSAGLVATGEVGTHKGEYFVNVRIAEAPSGKVIAVASERIVSVDELPTAIRKAASQLKEKLAAARAR